jgi:hypothetical protein
MGYLFTLLLFFFAAWELLELDFFHICLFWVGVASAVSIITTIIVHTNVTVVFPCFFLVSLKF